MASAPRLKQRNGVDIDYRAVFDAVPSLYLILSPDLVILDANDAYASAAMIDKHAVIGRDVFDVLPDDHENPGTGVANLRASLQKVLALGQPDAMAVQRYDIRTPDGNFIERHWSPINIPVLDGRGQIVCIIHRVENVTDVTLLQAQTAQKDRVARDQEILIGEMRNLNLMLATTLKENRKLQADRTYLADVMASSHDAIIARTQDGRIASWNRAAEVMYGYSETEAVGQPVAMLAPASLAQDAADVAARLERGEIVNQYETTRLRRDGSEFPVSVSAALVRNAAGAVIGSAAIVRDITEQRLARERLLSLQGDLTHLSRWNTMGMMASTIAHELNQPLAAMMNYVRAASRTLKAQSGAQAQPVLDLLDKAVEETRLAGNIIRSLRDFIDKRGTGHHVEDLNSVVEEAISLSQLAMPGGGVATKYELAPSLPPVLVDKVQIEQVLLNLIRNAIEAMEGHGQLTIATAAADPGFVAVSVCDDGPGLAPEIAGRLFQPFLTTKEKGMGIGLTICHSIIEAHGGSIGAAPVMPRGLCFRFRLPVAPPDTQRPKEKTAPH